MSGCWAAALCFSRERRRAGPAAMRQACSLVCPGSPESLCGPCSVSPGCLPLDASGSGRRCWQLWAADWHYNGGTINGEFLIPPVTRSFLLNHVCPLRSLQNTLSKERARYREGWKSVTSRKRRASGDGRGKADVCQRAGWEAFGILHLAVCPARRFVGQQPGLWVCVDLQVTEPRTYHRRRVRAV